MYRPVVPSVHHTSTGRAAASPIPWLDRRRKDHHQLRYLDKTVGMSEVYSGVLSYFKALHERSWVEDKIT